MTLIRKTDARRESGTLFTIPALDEEIPHGPRSKGDLLFTLNELDGRVTDVFGAWLIHGDALQSARRLYMAGVYGRGFLETKFITLSQAAEALHRAVYPNSLYLDDVEYRAHILPQLLAGIPTTLGADHRLSLKKRLEFGNEISLRGRLKTLCDKHAAAMGAVTGKVRPWVDAIVDCRNHLTHNPIGRSRSVTPDDLLKYNYVLKLLLECEFLSVMTFDEHEIETVVTRCQRYQQVRRRFFEGH